MRRGVEISDSIRRQGFVDERVGCFVHGTGLETPDDEDLAFFSSKARAAAGSAGRVAITACTSATSEFAASWGQALDARGAPEFVVAAADADSAVFLRGVVGSARVVETAAPPAALAKAALDAGLDVLYADTERTYMFVSLCLGCPFVLDFFISRETPNPQKSTETPAGTRTPSSASAATPGPLYAGRAAARQSYPRAFEIATGRRR